MRKTYFKLHLDGT